MNNKIRLSIIIPHYNSPKKLMRLLDTIDFTDDIQTIVVDDKSNKDLNVYNSLKNHEKYNKVMFVDNVTKSKGAGVSRNIGLQHASGEWILFADADDFFVENAFSVIRKYWNEEKDIVFFTPTSIIENTNTKSKRHLGYEKLIEEYLQKKEKSELFLRYGFRTPTSKIIKRELIFRNRINFSNTIVCNDDFFSVKVGFCAKTILATKDIIYCIEDGSSSLSKKREENYFWACFNESLKIDNYLKKILLKNDYKEIRLYSIPLLYSSMKRYEISIKSIFKAWIKTLKSGIPPFSFKKHLKKFLKIRKYNKRTPYTNSCSTLTNNEKMK